MLALRNPRYEAPRILHCQYYTPVNRVTSPATRDQNSGATQYGDLVDSANKNGSIFHVFVLTVRFGWHGGSFALPSQLGKAKANVSK